MINSSRRSFLLGGSAAFFVSGCRTCDWLTGLHNLRFGVLSDIHVTTPESAVLLESSFRYFKSRGVDAVMIPGDLTDWGIKRSLVYVKQAWDRVFGGTEVVPLFCTGNHDYDGWAYGDMTAEMHANGYDASDRLVKTSMADAWEEVFGEPFANFRLRTVRGYRFVSSEYVNLAPARDFLESNRDKLVGDKPFFYFQHLPIGGTTPDSNGWNDGNVMKDVLEQYPNCIAFTGHEHSPFSNEASIWQDGFTVISTPSLSYACAPSGRFENGSGNRGGKAWQTMPMIATRRDIRGGQGYVVSVYDDRTVIERVDMEEGGQEDGGAWVIPHATGDRPYEYMRRRRDSLPPVFPEDAELVVTTRNTENRSGFWKIVMNCEFPSAEIDDGTRVLYYQIRAVLNDGHIALAKNFLSPAYARHAKYEPERQRFWFDVAELPQAVDYHLEVYAYNSFDKSSKPLVSKVWKSKPGLDRVTEEETK